MSSSSTPNARSILALAFPALIVLSATPLYLLWDTAVVGRLGAQELAALAAGSTVLSTVTTQLTFLSYGTTARAARHYGAGRHADAVYEGVQATWVALAVGALLVAAVFSFTRPIMSFFTRDPEVQDLAVQWMHVTCASIIPALIVMAGNGWLRGMSNTRWPLWFTLLGVVPMAVTVPVAVRHYGMVGSAYANVLGELIVATCFLIALVLRWRAVGDGRSMAPQWPIIKAQLVLGRDLIARSLSFQVAFISAASVAGSFGAASLAAHQILLQLWNFLTLVLDSVAIAAQALVGAALGARQWLHARRVGVIVLRFSMVASVVIAVGLAAGASVLPRLFSSDAEVLDAMSVPWWMLVVLALLGGVVFALDGVLLGASDVAFLRTATIVSALVGFLPVVWLAKVFDWGLPGVWCGLVAFVAVRLVAVVWRFRGDAWIVNTS
ncbi:MATE family efflux transporter [Corynebacterium sp. zg254]|uniref:MATE family efflux transporter n=1 Tax=Corynebacterium zhongnanshanii TaxID=2768834 RepID=A0ABQ6VGB9_9CORY|nr:MULTISPECIES: MATE family efflux transporter [Corynebacterium]KAB3523363.1 MATE family efflux transporter [Corynebacterium zhongnanshanii]MCR5913514.1 MATE family efflux transporter [Corynebacterium sp. zg254]